tara:strand:+ start:25693 stop:27339 length:1647 start_codon:yes stop_codon:yes gene_type:complete
MLPHNLRVNKYFHKITNWIFYITNIPFILLNNIDIEYFRFTQKRSTIDFLQLLQLGEDSKNIIPQYMKSYWGITVFTTLQCWLVFKIRKIPHNKLKLNLRSAILPLNLLIISLGIFIVGARGGLQLKPIKPINAGELINSKNSGLILNTPFCILHSLKNKQLRDYNYFNNEELKTIYSPLHDSSNKLIIKENIVILIMESYSKEFVGFYNNGKGYTPFLDSLMEYSLVFTNAYANGLKSIEALPAITSSIPTLMTNPFITSDYAQNNFESMASHLNNIGYNTSFYHGGIRGTMGFYSFSKKARFKDYFGMEEYGNDSDFDGSWGIYDVPFMQYFANDLNIKEEPFFSTFFSLSSHPPYTLPDDYKQKITNHTKNIGIKETIEYSDIAMSKFFKEIQKYNWMKNTIFIITADHTSPESFNNAYKSSISRYSIPLIIFKGDSTLKGINTNTVQQIDIMPTVYDLINYNKPYFAFGKSMFDESWAVNFLQNKYRFISEGKIIVNTQENYSSSSDSETKNNINIETKDLNLLKAIKQQYNHRMLNNKLEYED